MNNIQMKTIIINKNKNYFKRIGIIVLMVFVLYILVKFLGNVSDLVMYAFLCINNLKINKKF